MHRARRLPPPLDPTNHPNPMKGNNMADSADRLAQIEGRAHAATPGPWGTYEDATSRIDIAADMRPTGHGYRCRRQIVQTVEWPIDNDQDHEHWTEEDDQKQIEADAEFIAYAPTDVLWLIQRVRELEAELNAVRSPA